ncbi:hypothetical protein ANABIO32_32020 [Rossellomorea marisflavi]|nr:hypothetical protein [Rossellomorea marisflavi]GLI85466.1 hypothetical protein ANABIO32_32020 [Rossellomorea marisflavi]
MFKENGEYQVTINGISHWVKVEGIERGTVPMVVIHGGPGGNLERTAGSMIAMETSARSTISSFFHEWTASRKLFPLIDRSSA